MECRCLETALGTTSRARNDHWLWLTPADADSTAEACSKVRCIVWTFLVGR